MNHQRIGPEEIEALKEILAMGYYPSRKEEVKFERAVCSLANCNRFCEIPEDKFEVCFLDARSRLQERGKRIFQRVGQPAIRFVGGLKFKRLGFSD